MLRPGEKGFNLEQLVTPLLMKYKYKRNMAVSLDPLNPKDPDGPFYKSVFYPP